MARWGRADFRQLQELERKLDRLSRVDFDRFCQQTARELAARLLADVKKRTPTGSVPDDISKNRKNKIAVVGASGKKRKLFSREAAIYQQYWAGYTGGSLRNAWTVSLSGGAGLGAYVVIIKNNLEYASYVEYGHRQQPGRYVPALGKSLKEAWVPGKYMLTIALQDLERILPALLEQRLYSFLQEVMS